MIETLNDLLLQPGVRKAMDSPVVAKQLERFKLFLGTFYLRLLNKWSEKIRRFLSLKTLILLNLALVSYYAGKSNAETLPEWFKVFKDIHLWFTTAIILNTTYLCIKFLRLILVLALRIAGIILIIWVLYRVYIWLKKVFNDDSEKDLSLAKND